jgi:nucleotide-binding universal stress UspA family protein
VSHSPKTVAIVFPFEAYEKATEENAAKVLSRAREVVEFQGTTCDVVHVKQQHPADGILEIAANRSCDLIVMGSHGYRGVTRFLLGSQADRVVTGSHVSVLICR